MGPAYPKKFDIPLTQLLNIKDRTYTTTGEIRGASGIDTLVDKQQLLLFQIERKDLAPGLTKQTLKPLSLKSLDLKV
ncbi:MAG: hypothetical protein U5K69_17670 [Balneolaceae bacterium]|nr:hypothetical protein [Balneolaceae bacterium]